MVSLCKLDDCHTHCVFLLEVEPQDFACGILEKSYLKYFKLVGGNMGTV